MILDIWDVSAIGRKSFSTEDGNEHFGMGEMIHCFSEEGRTPLIIEELYMLQITGATS